MRDLCRRAPDASSPACLHVVSPRRARPTAPARRPPPLRPLDPPASSATDACCELATAAVELDEADEVPRARTVDSRGHVAVRGEEELPATDEPRAPLAPPEDDRLEGDHGDERGRGGGGANRGARAYVTLPRRRAGVAAALYSGARLPPRRSTPDGTDIYYWCDLPKNSRRYGGKLYRYDFYHCYTKRIHEPDLPGV